MKQLVLESWYSEGEKGFARFVGKDIIINLEGTKEAVKAEVAVIESKYDVISV
jgi:hypothetical protein